MLDLNDFRTLLAVIDEGGISAAARKLHLSPSAMSDRIKSIEERVGFVLLNRHSRGSEPTMAAKHLSQEARILVQQSERLQGVIHTWRVRAQGELILHVNSNAIASFVPDILAQFLRLNPAVRVQVREALSRNCQKCPFW